MAGVIHISRPGGGGDGRKWTFRLNSSEKDESEW